MTDKLITREERDELRKLVSYLGKYEPADGHCVGCYCDECTDVEINREHAEVVCESALPRLLDALDEMERERDAALESWRVHEQHNIKLHVRLRKKGAEVAEEIAVKLDKKASGPGGQSTSAHAIKHTYKEAAKIARKVGGGEKK